jgi:hypothetical protein
MFPHLCEILGCFRLSGSGGAFRRSAQVEVERAHERPVTPVRQGGDDQAAAVAEILREQGSTATQEYVRLKEVGEQI